MLTVPKFLEIPVAPGACEISTRIRFPQRSHGSNKVSFMKIHVSGGVIAEGGEFNEPFVQIVIRVRDKRAILASTNC